MNVKTNLEELISKIVIEVIDKYMKEPFAKINEMLVAKIQPSINKIDELEKKIDEINTKNDEFVKSIPSAIVQPPALVQPGGSRKIKQPRNYTFSKKQNRKKQKYSTKRLR